MIGEGCEEMDKTLYVCYITKGSSQNTIFYTTLTILKVPWEDIIMVFVLGLPKTKQVNNSIVVVFNIFQIWHTLFLARRPVMPQE